MRCWPRLSGHIAVRRQCHRGAAATQGWTWESKTTSAEGNSTARQCIDEKTDQLAQGAAEGESFVIARDGKPLVEVVSVDAVPPLAKHRRGFLKGQISVPDDFDTRGREEIIRMFEGE